MTQHGTLTETRASIMWH